MKQWFYLKLFIMFQNMFLRNFQRYQSNFQQFTYYFIGQQTTSFSTNSRKISFISRNKMSSLPKKSKLFEASNMVWVDCEMTGLDLDNDHLIEIAVIVTDKNLEVLAEGPNLIIHQPKEVSGFILIFLHTV